MALELHIWGPAFELPSIDPQCLAAVAYCSKAIPLSGWKLIASNDPEKSPTKKLPVLRDGDNWISGFRNITKHLEKISNTANGIRNPDSNLTALQKADTVAFSSLIESSGQSLIDLSFFVSSRNYNTVIRPFYSTILSVPTSYIIPPALKSAAKRRTAYLNVSSLDYDEVEEEANKTNSQLPNPVPPHLRTQRTESILSPKSDAVHAIRLDGIASAFFEPLNEFRGDKLWMLTDAPEPTSLDCLAFAYLALCSVKDLPSPWLAVCLENKFPRLHEYVESALVEFFGKRKDYLAAYSSDEKTNKEALPWVCPVKKTAGEQLARFAGSLVAKLPFIHYFQASPIINEDEVTTIQRIQSRNELWVTGGSIVIGLGLFAGFIKYHKVLSVGALGAAFLGPGAILRRGDLPPRREEETAGDDSNRTGLQRYGAAGDALDAMFGPM